MKRFFLITILWVAACEGDATTLPPGPQTLGGVEVDHATLARGQRLYRRYCQSCHGAEGDGAGPSATAAWPRPRDFRTARFKYAGIEDRGLPADEELLRIVRHGLNGTSMSSWGLSDDLLLPILQYIKTFSPAEKGFRNPKLRVKAPAIPADPFDTEAKQRDAIERGKKLYHSYFECAKCHPSYVEPEAFARWEASQRADAPYLPQPKWSPNYRAVLVPPDFLRHPIRSARVESRAGEPTLRGEDLYRIVAYGLQGPMPGYGHLGEEDVWAVAHYVKSLGELRLRDRQAALSDAIGTWANR